MGRLLFLSDLHLSPSRPRLLERFRRLLEAEAGRCAGLYLLGDLFDAWIGDDDPSPFAEEVRGLLRAFSRQTPLFFQHGNRDFLVGDRFAAETGVRLLPEASVLERDGLRLLLMHGDRLCTDDLEYQEARRILRSPEFRRHILSLAIPERRALAEEYRRRSGEAMSLKAADIMDANREAVAEALRSHRADWLIHGHTHRPGDHRFLLDGRPARRLVLPDWRETSPRIGLELESGTVRWLERAP